MKRSSGILLWKKENNQYYVLLTHFGGPYWDKLDKGAWSVQKGLVESNEKVLNAAIRESSEETNLILNNKIDYLASKKVSNNKLGIMFESYFDGDIFNFKSNSFTLEEALTYINPSQTFFIKRLKEKLSLKDQNN